MRGLLALIFITTQFFSCNKSSNCDSFKQDCSNVRCIAAWSYFDFKLVDKTSGADLVFGNNPRYAANDIKLFRDAARTQPFYFFSVDNANKKFHLMDARDEIFLEVKGVDVYKLTTVFRAIDCCSSRVKTLWVDGKITCTCCGDIVSIPVK